MSFLLRAIGLVSGGAIPNFSFNPGTEICKCPSATGLQWTLRHGTRNDASTSTGSSSLAAAGELPQSVSIFEFSVAPGSASAASIELARHVLRRCKTLMLPGVLRCFEATEYNNTIYIATEECLPLAQFLDGGKGGENDHRGGSGAVSMDPDTLRQSYYDESSGDKFDEGVALGLRHCTEALRAMHGNHLIHGNVGHESVFVIRSGEWRLFGLEFVANMASDEVASGESMFQRHWGLLPEYRRPPETLSSSSSGSGGGGVSAAVDSWGLATLLFSIYGKVPLDRLSSVKAAEMRTCRSFPRTLQTAFTGLAGANPKMRMTVEKFAEDCEFVAGSTYVECLHDLEQLALKDVADREALYRKLTTHIDQFPLRACKYLILSKLSVAVQYGGGSATALEPLLKIGARLTDPTEFAELVAPVVMTLFASPDPLVRIRLLSSAAQYARLLPATLVNEKIWPLYATGFASTNANLRELTVRALVHFAPLLNEKIFANDVVRCISQLQQDKEGPIRTNATICLCLIADVIPASMRAKTLLHGFGRMLKDPFAPSRVAAIRSLSSTLPHYPAQMLAEAILPGVAPLTIDPSSQEIREYAFRILEQALDTLRRHAAEFPVVAPSQQQDANANATPTLTSEPTGTPSTGSRFGAMLWGSSSNVTTTPSTPVVPTTTAAAPTAAGGDVSSSTTAASVKGTAAPTLQPQQQSSAKSTTPVTVVDNGWNDFGDDDDVAMVTGGAGSSGSTAAVPERGDGSVSSAANPVTTTPIIKSLAKPGVMQLGGGASKKRGFGGGAASKVE